MLSVSFSDVFNIVYSFNQIVSEIEESATANTSGYQFSTQADYIYENLAATLDPLFWICKIGPLIQNNRPKKSLDTDFQQYLKSNFGFGISDHKNSWIPIFNTIRRKFANVFLPYLFDPLFWIFKVFVKSVKWDLGFRITDLRNLWIQIFNAFRRHLLKFGCHLVSNFLNTDLE